MTFLIWTLLAAALLIVCLVLGRYSQAARIREWHWVLTPDGRRAATNLALHAELDAAMADDAYAGAWRARTRADLAEAARLLALAFSVVQEATPSRLLRLRQMAKCARMAIAILPMPGLRPSGFRLRSLATLAGFGLFVHQLLVSPSERFLLRLKLLALGFRMAVRSMRSSERTVGRQEGASAAWAKFEKGLADWKVLDAEHVESFRALMMSLTAHPRPGVLLPYR